MSSALPVPSPTAAVFGDRRALLCIAFFLAALGYHGFHSVQGWDRPIADFNPWRQSQTALTAWYFLRDGFSLAYPLPVLGPPWSVPFEFPTYQWLVASLAASSGLPLESSGRAVSLAAFYVALLAVNALLRDVLHLRHERFFVLGFLLLSPVYISWSRAFSIESTALALSLWYLVAFQRWTASPRALIGLVLAGLGIAAGLTKITTFFVFGAAAAVLLVSSLGLRLAAWRARGGFLAATLLLAFALPLGFTIAWVGYTDAIKASSPLTESLTSSALATWNYGTLSQRLSPATWRQFELYGSNLVISRYNVLLAALCLALYPGSWRRVLVLGALFALPPLVFTNLYFAHDYYWYANGLFVLVALGLAFVPLVTRPTVPLAAGVIACVLIFYQYRNTYQGWYGPVQQRVLSPLLPLAAKIKELTPPDAYSLVYGFDWDPLLAYQSERRMIMQTVAHRRTPLNEAPLADAIAQAGRPNLGAIVFVGDSQGEIDFVRNQLRALGVSGAPAYADAAGAIYLVPPP